ncbi:MAG: divalent-cation tolerance protein CutA [Proteobacteria bacterium]|nr:divalent-cation tolerance protein CutA [Pseudomonadota bacterium]
MVYVTASSKDEALQIGRVLVKERLAACANILEGMHSIYRWQGAVEEAQETVLILKTRTQLAGKAIARVAALHSYDVPCAVTYDMTNGLAAYLDWIDVSTSQV